MSKGDITLEIVNACVAQFTAQYRRRHTVPVPDLFFHTYSFVDQLEAARQDEICRLEER